MKKLLQQIKWDAIMLAALYIALGIVCVVIPETMVKTLGYMIGALLIVAGAVSMICYLLREAHQNYYRNDFVHGLVSIAIGIIVLYKVNWLIDLVPVILGILVIASGCSKLQDVIDMKRMEYGSWVLMLILATINVVAGIVLVLNPFETVLLLFQLIGVSLIFSGLTDGITILYFAGKIKKYYESVNAVDSTYEEIAGTGKKAKEKPVKEQLFKEKWSKEKSSGETVYDGGTAEPEEQAAEEQKAGENQEENSTDAEDGAVDGEERNGEETEQ